MVSAVLGTLHVHIIHMDTLPLRFMISIPSSMFIVYAIIFHFCHLAYSSFAAEQQNMMAVGVLKILCP